MSAADYINGEFRDYIAAEAGDEVADSACRMLSGFVDGLRRSVRADVFAELQPQLDRLQALADARQQLVAELQPHLDRLQALADNQPAAV